ncbi:tumor protein D53 isoform X2 [Electrophorus electricus]|uniref:tumor protein D53 isoform X2 n=1 Tax=Electrophorus electricus TaxID=8005 RepID=UPI0015D07A51|nr:tumor protein D53 isoform X2 [Electrophorus electricus]
MEPRRQELYSSILTLEEGDLDDDPLHADLPDSDSLKDVKEATVPEVDLNNTITEKETDEMQHELIKLEEEIATLKQVLASKEKRQSELKQCLGVSSLSGLKENLSRGWSDMQSTTAYKKTSETLSTAGQRTSVAFNNLGTAISRKIGDMSIFGLELLYPRSYSIHHSMSMPPMRNSSSFKSFEEKVESTMSNIKLKVGGSSSGGSFEDVLSSTAQACAQDVPTNNPRDNTEFP